ncbi:MAG: divalent-cation tolerance protein CutA [Armatimonadota bacterium]|nr:divalent-cation tolerance protein CutA [Armatimonadota bacterium]MDR7452403.1 divalent-cation tolerance protein CutA [Armatimonadota bacterium]MDR7466748.1 divalent-cation tolerance protein CutA [Armatimonadota bacterium]MDR7492778.1 divalent-cation tolerance protein CutA [Armatimonadota bacterium]MDR7498554.1 divalent-cation tolerance protein CutA [Armatimonadota bacterium]
MREHIVVLVTAPSREEAERIGRAVVEDRLAACANVVPAVASTYWWRGAVEQAGEALLVLKTCRDLLEPLGRRVRALHSYTVPEVIALPIAGGNPDYLRWIDESVRAPGGEP